MPHVRSHFPATHTLQTRRYRRNNFVLSNTRNITIKYKTAYHLRWLLEKVKPFLIQMNLRRLSSRNSVASKLRYLYEYLERSYRMAYQQRYRCAEVLRDPIGQLPLRREPRYRIRFMQHVNILCDGNTSTQCSKQGSYAASPVKVFWIAGFVGRISNTSDESLAIMRGTIFSRIFQCKKWACA